MLVALVHPTGETRLEAVWTIIPSPLDGQDRIAALFVVSILSAGVWGGIVRLTETGAERVVAPRLSAASAVSTYDPETALLQKAVQGLLEISPTLLIPAKN